MNHPILAIDRAWAIERDIGMAALTLIEQLDVTPVDVSAAIDSDRSGARTYDIDGGVAIIPIGGPLTKAWSCASWMMGGSFTARIRRQVRAAARDDDVTSILLLIDSPGGQVAGTAELADDVRDAATKKKVVAYIEDMGCSAAYWIASQASEIVCNRTAMVGSIGVYGVIHDLSRRADMMGVKVHVISTGPHKGAGVEGSQIAPEHLAKAQESIDTLAMHFYEAIAAGRRMNLEQVRELATGETWIGQAAVDLGLVDRVEALDVTLNSLQSAHSGKYAATAGEPTPQEEIMSDKAQKVGILASLIAMFGLSKADLDVQAGDDASPAATDINPGSPATDTGDTKSTAATANKALQAAASQLAHAEIRAFADEMIAQGRLTTAERANFEALMAESIKADGGGAFALTDAGALVTGATTDAFRKVAEARPTHRLFNDHVPGAQVDDQRSAVDERYAEVARKSFRKES